MPLIETRSDTRSASGETSLDGPNVGLTEGNPPRLLTTLDVAALDALLTDHWRNVGAPTNVLLAVSGGGDSMALLARASVLKDHGARVWVATVDHGLRPDSAAEAALVKRAASAQGFSHVTLRWEGDKPTTGIQHAARRTRYRLLARHSADINRATGARGVIMTAHSADDLAETVMMRDARGANDDRHPGAIASMARGAIRPHAIAAGPGAETLLLRPFINVRRPVLRAAATLAGYGFIDEPSNDDPRFERVRIRRQLAGDDHLIENAWRRAWRSAASAERERRAIADDSGAWCLTFFDWGGARFQCPPETDLEAEPHMGALFLARLVFAIGAGAYPPTISQATEAMTALQRGKKTSLGGVLMAPGRAGVFCYREPAALLGRAGVPPMVPVLAKPHTVTLWDNRFTITNTEETPFCIAPLGAAIDLAAHDFGDSAPSVGAPKDVLSTVPGAFAIPENGGLGRLIATPLSQCEDFRCLSAERFDGAVIRF